MSNVGHTETLCEIEKILLKYNMSNEIKPTEVIILTKDQQAKYNGYVDYGVRKDVALCFSVMRTLNGYPETDGVLRRTPLIT